MLWNSLGKWGDGGTYNPEWINFAQYFILYGKLTGFNRDDHALTKPRPNQKRTFVGNKGERAYCSFRSK